MFNERRSDNWREGQGVVGIFPHFTIPPWKTGGYGFYAKVGIDTREILC